MGHQMGPPLKRLQSCAVRLKTPVFLKCDGMASGIDVMLLFAMSVEIRFLRESDIARLALEARRRAPHKIRFLFENLDARDTHETRGISAAMSVGLIECYVVDRRTCSL